MTTEKATLILIFYNITLYCETADTNMNRSITNSQRTINYQRKRKMIENQKKRKKNLIVKEFISLRKLIRILIYSDKTNNCV